MHKEQTMKKIVSMMVMVAVMAFGVLAFTQVASAEEKCTGAITKIEMAADAASATVTVKDNKTEKDIVVIINDAETLDKFKDHRINEGDEIKMKYENSDGKNVSKYFRKTAGC
jgi:Ni/Co efflux regulator RcnB